MNIRKEINKKVSELGISIRSLSEKSSVRRQSIMKFLKGGNIHIQNLEYIINALDCELNIIKKVQTNASVNNLLLKRLKISKNKLELFCKKQGIVYLAFFGSILQNDFNKNSDIDVIIKFDHNISFFELLDVEEKLQKLFNTKHKVDLVTENSISSLIRKEIENSLEVIYEKAA